MLTLVTTLQVLVSILVITLVLLQPSKGGSFFSASNQGVFGSSGGTNFLFKATMWCSLFLAASCLFLSWFRLHEAGESVIVDTKVNAQPLQTPAPTAPAESAPATPSK
jgi:protein translocase SecG subunit